jgi:signal-transduction protein with cAMP-binding, CBS, and nucleotidyltransferase domain
MKTAADILRTKTLELVYVNPETTIEEALKIMNQYNIGAILIRKDQEFVGIWTERDLMNDILSEGFNHKTAKINNYMTKGLQSAEHTETVYQLWDKFLGKRLRHLLIKKGDKYIGLLSTGDVIKASLNEKNQELRDLNAMMSWEYYENWRWTPKK